MNRLTRHKSRILVAITGILAIFILALGIALSHPAGFIKAGGVPPPAATATATTAPAATATTAPAETPTPAPTATTAPTATSTTGNGSTANPNPQPPGCPFNPFDTACNVNGVPSWVYCLVLLGLIILLLLLVFTLSRGRNNRNQAQNRPPRQPSTGAGGTPAAGSPPSS